jgi:hypothetical protein
MELRAYAAGGHCMTAKMLRQQAGRKNFGSFSSMTA